VGTKTTDFHKTQRMGSVLTFLQRYWEEGDEFLDRIMTGDKTWVQFVNAETKEQSKQWMHSCSPNRPKKFKQTLPNKKLMATMFPYSGLRNLKAMNRGCSSVNTGQNKILIYFHKHQSHNFVQYI